MDSSPAASSSYVANAVFVTAAPAVIPKGNTRIGEFEKLSVSALTCSQA